MSSMKSCVHLEFCSKKKMSTKKLLDKIKQLEYEIYDDDDLIRDNILNLVDYIEKDNTPPKVIHAVIHSLYRIFLPLLSKGDLQLQTRELYIRYVNKLIDFLGHAEPGLQIPSLKILLDLLKSESAFLTISAGSYQFSNNHFFRIVEGLLDNENFSEPLKNEFIE
ncbi:14097_t:CDS:2, partial [Ambispora leptoticha]